MSEHRKNYYIGERDPRLEPGETTHLGASRPELMGGIACRVDLYFEDKEKTDVGVEMLDGMRTWLHESDAALLKAGQVIAWRERYPGLFDQMENIHQAAVSVDSENSLSYRACESLLANYVHYLEGNNLDTELTPGRLTALYEAYAVDVMICREIKITDAERVACHQGKQALLQLIDTYGSFDFIRGDDFVKAMSNYARSPEVYFERLVYRVTHFQMVTEPALREEYGFNGAPWSSTFIAGLSRRFSDVEQVARNIFELIPRLRDAYKYATEATIERWAKQLITEQQSKRKVEVDELLKEVPVIKIESSERECAAKALDQLRHALLNSKIRVSASNLDSPGVHRLIRVAEANWHESFEEVDMFGAARNIYFMIKAYNASIEKSKANTASLIAMTPASLHAILVAFTSDISALKKEVAPSKAAKVARYWSPSVCQRLREQFQAEDISISAISSLVANNPSDITSAVKGYVERRDTLKEILKPERLIGLQAFALRNDGPARARKYLDFLPQAREQYHWVSRVDVAEFFYTSDTPVTQFNAWAEKVQAIRAKTGTGANRASPNFSVLVVKKLAKDTKRDAEAIIKAHTEKCNALYAPYKNNDFVTRTMISLWAIRRSTPEDAIREHLKRIDEVKRILVKAGEDDGDSVLVRDLAFHGNNPQKTVAQYLDIKRMLEIERDTGSEGYIEQWMIVQVASRSNQLKYAKHKLSILSWMTRQGSLLPKDGFGEKSHQIEKVAAEKNYSSFVDLKHITDLVGSLHELDRMAVLAVFGFDEEYRGEKIDTPWLEEELGVTNLEAYVMEEVVPHIRSIS